MSENLHAIGTPHNRMSVGELTMHWRALSTDELCEAAESREAEFTWTAKVLHALAKELARRLGYSFGGGQS